VEADKMGSMYNYLGDVVLNEYRPTSFDKSIKGIAHRGFSSIAPENTIPSYILAAQKGFRYMETDVCLTADGVPVLLHDDTIDRTSNGSGKITTIPFDTVRQYDFGSWKSPKYAGTKIPTLEEYLALCRTLMLYPYIEFKNSITFTQQQVEEIVAMTHKYGLKDRLTFMSFKLEYLEWVKAIDETARLGWPPTGTPTTADLNICKSLMTGKNEVFVDPQYTKITDDICNMFREENIQVEVWTIDSEAEILALNPYVSAVTSNSLHAGRVLYDSILM
jgi:glycerophosphoryl diester phosphodiesterase